MDLLDIPPILSWAPEVIAVFGAGFYLRYRSVRHRYRKYKYATLLWHELSTIKVIILNNKNYNESRTSFIPHGIYDGLVTSTNIAYIPVAQLGYISTIYRLVEWINEIPGERSSGKSYDDFNVETDDPMATLKSLVDPTIEELQTFRNKCKPRWYDYIVTKLMDLSD